MLRRPCVTSDQSPLAISAITRRLGHDGPVPGSRSLPAHPDHVTSGHHQHNLSTLVTTKFHLRYVQNQNRSLKPCINFSKSRKRLGISDVSIIVCIMIFVAFNSDLVSCFLWLVWVWAAKLCHVPGMCRGPGFCDKNTLRYISWHYNQKHDQCHTPHDQLAYSLIPTIGKMKETGN